MGFRRKLNFMLYAALYVVLCSRCRHGAYRDVTVKKRLRRHTRHGGALRQVYRQTCTRYRSRELKISDVNVLTAKNDVRITIGNKDGIIKKKKNRLRYLHTCAAALCYRPRRFRYSTNRVTEFKRGPRPIYPSRGLTVRVVFPAVTPR